MHQEAFEFVARTLAVATPPRAVVELGSRAVNGSIRSLLPPDARFVGVDLTPGLNVDVVADAAEFAPAFAPDLVVCCETLEHTPRARAVVLNAARMLAPGGRLVLTAATAPRPPHSAADGGPPLPGEFYCNVAPEALEDWLAEAGFRSWKLDVHPRGDVRAVAFKFRDYATEPLRLYAVVATMNALERTKELEAAFASCPLPLRPIFIDNGSRDGTRPWLLTLPRDGAVVLLNERNLGAAGAWNLGARYAFENGAEAVLICGHDAVPIGDAIQRLVRHVERGVGLVTGTAVPPDAPAVDEASRDAGLVLADDPDLTAFVVSRELHDALRHAERGTDAAGAYDLFDPRFYPAYCEDDDLLLRLHRAGLPAHRDPAARFRHDPSLAVRKTPELAAARDRLMECNVARFEAKWGCRIQESPAKKRRALNVDQAVWARDFGARPVCERPAEEAAVAARRALGRRFARRSESATPFRAAPRIPLAELRRRLRILWCSNAPWVPTGYGQQTKLFVRRLIERGHAVAIHCLYGLDYGSMQWEGVPCFPRGAHALGHDLIAAHADRFDADVVMTLLDVWPFEPESFAGRHRWAPWFPDDHEPLPAAIKSKLAHAARPIAMSRFGEIAAREAGLSPLYVPHGVDTRVFAPADRRACRAELGLPADAFVLGMVAANKDFPSRKAFPQCFLAFAEILRREPRALLYVHSMTGDLGGKGGVDLKRLAAEVGVADSVVFADQYAQIVGSSEAHMARLYNAFDVLLSPSLGEGFGIPILEAQACGTPVVVGDWTAMSELCFAGEKIAKDDAEKYWTRLAAWQFVAHPGAVARAALNVKRRIESGEDLRSVARAGALPYDADVVLENYLEPALYAVSSPRIGSP